MYRPSQTEVCATLTGRIQDHAREWSVVVEDVFETESSAIAFGTRGNLPVVLKVIKHKGTNGFRVKSWRHSMVTVSYAFMSTFRGQC